MPVYAWHPLRRRPPGKRKEASQKKGPGRKGGYLPIQEVHHHKKKAGIRVLQRKTGLGLFRKNHCSLTEEAVTGPENEESILFSRNPYYRNSQPASWSDEVQQSEHLQNEELQRTANSQTNSSRHAFVLQIRSADTQQKPFAEDSTRRMPNSRNQTLHCAPV